MMWATACIAIANPSGWVVEAVPAPLGEVVEVGGIAFPQDGAIAVSTRRGRVWLIDGALDNDPSDATWTIFADGLYEGLGLDTAGDDLMVLQRGELSLLRDTDGDRRVDDIEVIADDWGLSDNYHEFAFGLPRDAAGNRYVSFNLGFMQPDWWHGKAVVPNRGSIMQVSPSGNLKPWAHGFRSPCGLGFDATGRLLATDNQGDWMPSSPIFVVQKDGFHGHPASLRWTDAYRASNRVPDDKVPPDVDRVPAAIWIPYDWSRSTGNIVADTTGGAFGPFADQLFVSELTTGRILRAEIEDIDGVSQGAVWPFIDRVGSVARVAFAPDGSLICGLTNRGWGGLTPGHGVRRIRFTGEVPMEMKHVRLVPGGFDIEMTYPIEGEVLPSQVHVDTYDYNWWWKYGSPEQRKSVMQVSETRLSADRRTLHVSIPMLRAGRVARLRLTGVMGQGGLPLVHEEVAYTINRLPGGPSGQVAKEVEPPSAESSVEDESGWLRLTWGDATDMWDGDWRLSKAKLDLADRRRFVHESGSDALVNDQATTDLALRAAAPDGVVAVAVMLPSLGVMAIGLPGDATLVVRDLENHGSIEVHDNNGVQIATSDRDIWRGPGQWHRIEYVVRKNQLQRVSLDDMVIMTDVSLPEGGADNWLRFHAAPGPGGIADVRLQPDRAGVPEGGENLLAGQFEFSGDLGGMVGEDSMVLSGGGVVQLSPGAPSTCTLRARIRFEEKTAAVLNFGGAAIVLAGHAPTTGSIIRVDERSVDLIPANGWFDLQVTRSEGRVVVHLNGLEVASGHVAGAGPLSIALQEGRLTIGWMRIDSTLD
jgi:glucose/arabinose dehydrogenase